MTHVGELFTGCQESQDKVEHGFAKKRRILHRGGDLKIEYKLDSEAWIFQL